MCIRDSAHTAHRLQHSAHRFAIEFFRNHAQRKRDAGGRLIASARHDGTDRVRTRQPAAEAVGAIDIDVVRIAAAIGPFMVQGYALADQRRQCRQFLDHQLADQGVGGNVFPFVGAEPIGAFDQFGVCLLYTSRCV